MSHLRYTLVTDGSSDVVLLPILKWLLIANGVTCALQAEWADLRRVPLPAKPTLADKILLSLELYPCDLLFVHRDAENALREKRVEEIAETVEEITGSHSIPVVVCVVPVRMQEAWLLFDEVAIRYAAGNRAGRQLLNLPPLKQLETLPDPKTELHECLRRASNLSGRRLRHFPVGRRARRVADFIDDFSPLRALSAFIALEDDLKRVIEREGWNY